MPDYQSDPFDTIITHTLSLPLFLIMVGVYAVLIGENGGALTLLVSKTVTHIAFADLGNRNVSNCDLINCTALALREQFFLCLHDLEPVFGSILSAGEPGRVCN